MRIGIDARFFGSIGKGLGRYTQKLIEELEKIDISNEYFVFLRKANWDEYQVKNPNFHKVLADVSWYTLEEQLKMPKILRKYKLDLVHFPHFNIPLGYRRKFVVTIHDLILLEFPTKRATTLGPIKYFFKNIAYHTVIAYAVSKSQRVISISQYTKESILKNFRGVTSSKIQVVYEGIDLGRFNSLQKEKYDFAKYGLKKKKYLLYVGNAYPHKNIQGFVQAFDTLKKDERYKDLKLVLVGKEDYFFGQIKDIVKDLATKSDIVFSGFVPDKQLIDLYENCALYVFPSLYEGFGLPPLEAMASGATVLCSDKTCLPEIFGKSVVYFDPANSKNFVDKLSFVLENLEQIREKKQVYVNDTLAKYSWEQMAKETKKIYEKSVR
jgi:glycosyltransferase involved in cell wall biosynthesis